jgi:hypothetical protein
MDNLTIVYPICSIVVVSLGSKQKVTSAYTSFVPPVSVPSIHCSKDRRLLKTVFLAGSGPLRLLLRQV